jgi:dihydrofolate reductase
MGMMHYQRLGAIFSDTDNMTTPMRKVVLFIATSLDGFIARPDGGIDWLFSDADYGYAAFFDSIDTVVMGRKTYELSLSFGPPYVYEGKASYVFSRTNAGTKDEHAEFIAGSSKDFIHSLRARAGKDIWLVGGAELVRDFLAEDLIDEFVISIHPIVLGAGMPLFPADARELSLTLKNSIAFESGLVQLHYERMRASVTQ